MSPPVFILIAGPNGAGKSSFTLANPHFFSSYPLLDPDVIAKTIQVDALNPSQIAAGREVLMKVDNHLRKGESFAVETTLSGKNYIETIRRARVLSFSIRLVYVGTSDPQINIHRIERRVIGGGHHVPDADVRRRYRRSMANLVIAAHLSDFAVVFDNSSREGYREVAVIHQEVAHWNEPIPSWVAALKASFG